MLPILTALKVLILAGGVSAEQNHHSHKVHVDALLSLLDARGVPNEDVTIFWADGEAPTPDRAVRDEPIAEDEWLLEGVPLGRETAVGPSLLDTRFIGRDLRPARRAALQAWFRAEGPALGPGDTLLIAVTDHGEPDPEGGPNTRVSLWGETWSAEELEADLSPVPTTARVVLWMSQCYSGGFAELSRRRANTCGAFSTTADRVAYGCDPRLAERVDVGHFQRLLAGLASGPGDIAHASDQSALRDDTPDTPYLSSDALLFELIERRAARLKTSPGRLTDSRLGRLPLSAPVRRQAAEIAARYGLGVLPDYSSTMGLLDEIDAARYALGQWMTLWGAAFDHARELLSEPLFRHLRLGRSPSRARLRAARAHALERLSALSRGRAGLRLRLEALHTKLQAIVELGGRADLQEAATLRVAYLYARAAGRTLLEGPDAARYEALRRCETTPLLPPAAHPGPAAPTPTWAPRPPAASLSSAVASLRPGYLGLSYRDGADGVAVVQRPEPGSPALLSDLRPGDRVIRAGDWRLDRSGAFLESVLLTPPGRWLSLSIKRGRKILQRRVLVVAHPLPPAPPRVGEAVGALRLKALDPARPLPNIGEGRSVVLFFWSTTCGPCRAAEAALSAWAKSRGTAVIAVSREDRRTIRRALRARHQALPFPVALDPTGEAGRLFEVGEPPVFALIDGRGDLADVGEGFADAVPLR